MINPPAGVDYGIQEGSGSSFTIISKQRSAGKTLVFDFEIRIGESKEDMVRFLGPVAQGPTDGKFVYICIGTFAGQKDSVWERRLKIPLIGITKQMIDYITSGTNRTLETTVPGVARDNGPNCGTVKPFEGWKISTK